MHTRLLPLLVLLVVAGCDDDRPTETKSFFDPAKKPAAGAAPALPAGHPPLGGAPAPTPAPAAAPPVAAGSPVVRGEIVVAESLAGSVPQGVLYIVARMPVEGAAQGPPVLVKRLEPGSFPRTFVLTSADVMMQGMPMPEKVVLQARVDQDGDAISRTPGDLFGQLEGVATGAEASVRLELDTRIAQSAPGRAVGQ